ncbi:MAG: hypothetical protein MZW92_36270 [Comamonadaceae bacterium]|nr:hypothetical protein [Comamonadaceae bacterium]
MSERWWWRCACTAPGARRVLDGGTLHRHKARPALVVEMRLHRHETLGERWRRSSAPAQGCRREWWWWTDLYRYKTPGECWMGRRSAPAQGCTGAGGGDALAPARDACERRWGVLRRHKGMASGWVADGRAPAQDARRVLDGEAPCTGTRRCRRWWWRCSPARDARERWRRSLAPAQGWSASGGW